MTADNKPQQIKRENVKKMLALKTDNAFGNLLTKVRQTKRGIDEMWQSVRRIEQEQDEILRKEDEEYALQKETERQKAAQESGEPLSPVAAQESVPTPVVQEIVAPVAEAPKVEASAAKKPVAAAGTVEAAPAQKVEAKREQPVVAAVAEQPKPEATVVAAASEQKSEPVVQPPVAAQPAAPVADAAAKTDGTRIKTFTPTPEKPRPSFMAPNQSRPTYKSFDRPQSTTAGKPSYLVGNNPRPTFAGGRPSTFPPRPAFNRPGGPAGGSRTGFTRPSTFAPSPDFNAAKQQRPYDAKKEHTKVADDKKAMSKRTLIRKGFVDGGYDEDRMGSKKIKGKKKSSLQQIAPPVTKAYITTENLTVKMLSEQIGVPAQVIIKQLMNLNQMASINSVIDFENMALVAIELGVELELKLDKTKEEQLTESHVDADDDQNCLVERPPIVTVMGHVDHGKTSLLDALRKTSVVEGEAGGITQHIGAYTVTLNGKKITFIDTPGHEAFTEMRARGAKVTDIAVIVIAADDGIMPQTIEAINHAKAANCPIVVAVNKIDKPTANIDRIKQQLTEQGIVAEEWGGDSPVVGVSAKSGVGLDKLLENILMLAELKELRANPDRTAKGTIIEARLDKGKGPVASIIVQNGTLRVGDTVVSGTTYGHIRAMSDDKGRAVKEAGPSMPVSVLGFQDVPNAGGLMYVVDEKLAKQVVSERSSKAKSEQQVVTSQSVSLDDVFNKISEGQVKVLNLIVKADVQGTVEALKTSLSKLGNDEVHINTIHGGVGAINKSDVMLAEASKAIIIGFNVRPDAETKSIAESEGIDIRLYRVIYEAIDDITAAVKGMLQPKFREQLLGHAEIRNIFKITGSGIIAGCYVTDGKITRKAKLRVLRENVVIAEGTVDSLKRFKEDVKEVATGYECGIGMDTFSEYKDLDVLEAFNLEEIKV